MDVLTVRHQRVDGETAIATITVDESRNTVDSNAPNGRSVRSSHEYRGVPVDASEVDVPRNLDVKPTFGDTCGLEALRGIVSQPINQREALQREAIRRTS